MTQPVAPCVSRAMNRSLEAAIASIAVAIAVATYTQGIPGDSLRVQVPLFQRQAGLKRRDRPSSMNQPSIRSIATIATNDTPEVGILRGTITMQFKNRFYE